MDISGFTALSNKFCGLDNVVAAAVGGGGGGGGSGGGGAAPGRKGVAAGVGGGGGGGNAKVSAEAARGVESLKQHINRYFSQLISVIEQHGGDVVKFAGDAILVVWPGVVHELEVQGG